MSVIDSQVDRAEAEARLADASAEQLRIDLEYWTVAGHDHAAEFNELSERRAAVQRLYLEASTMVSLIGEELVKRRNAKRGGS